MGEDEAYGMLEDAFIYGDKFPNSVVTIYLMIQACALSGIASVASGARPSRPAHRGSVVGAWASTRPLASSGSQRPMARRRSPAIATGSGGTARGPRAGSGTADCEA